MDTRGYAHIRKSLDDAGIVAGISPVPSAGEEVSCFTIKYDTKRHTRRQVMNALGARRCESAREMRITALTPELKLVSRSRGRLTFEDVLDWHRPLQHDMSSHMADW